MEDHRFLSATWRNEEEDKADSNSFRMSFWYAIRIPFLGVAYSAASISAVFLNKIILSRSGQFKEFQSVEFLMLFQSLIGTVLLLICGWCHIIQFPILVDGSRLLRISVVNIFFVLMTVASAYSVRWLSLPMTTLLKNCQVVVVCVLEYLFVGTKPGKLTMASLSVIVFGSLCGSATDLEYSFVGYIWMAISILSSAFYLVSIKLAFREYHIEQFTLVFYNNLFSVPFFFVASLPRGMFMHSLQYLANGSILFWVLILISGFTGVGVNVTTYLFVSVTSPTSFSVIGVVKKIAQTLLGYLTWTAPTNAGNVLSVYVGLVGGIAYSIAKKLENRR
jgi:hypothetical protein